MQPPPCGAHSCVLFLLLLSLLFSLFGAEARVCVVDSTGTVSSADYASLSTAIANCRAAQDPIAELRIQGTFDVTNVPIPNDVHNITILSLTGSNLDATLIGGPFLVDTTATLLPSIALINVSVDFAGSNASLFSPALGNQNATFIGCVMVNYTGDYLFRQEACIDQVAFVMIGNTIIGATRRILELVGMAGWVITDNLCRFCGTELPEKASLVHIKQTDVVSLPRIFNSNTFYRAVNCRSKPRCLYSVGGNGFYVRCNRGEIECFDRVATAARGNCALESFELVDPATNATETVLEYALSCRIYAPCVCSSITYGNTTSGQRITVAAGNIVYGGNTVRTVLPCRPRIPDPFGKRLYLFRDENLLGTRYVNTGDDKNINDVFKDKADSAIVGPGYTVTLYKDKNYGGTSLTFSGFVPELTSYGLHDAVTSVKWAPVPWESADTPVWLADTSLLPLANENAANFGYYARLWRRPANIVFISATNTLTGVTYTGAQQAVIIPRLTFDNGSFFQMYFDSGVIYPNVCREIDCQNGPAFDSSIGCAYELLASNGSNTQIAIQFASQLLREDQFESEDDTYGQQVPYPATPWDGLDYIGSQCLNGDAYCCATPDDAAPYVPVYRYECSADPNATVPITYPNGSLAGNLTQVPAALYRCSYLVNCTYDSTAQELQNCKKFQCGLTPCRLGVNYTAGDYCYDALNLNDSAIACVDGNENATDALCQFLRLGCDAYYYSGYLKDGYTFARDAALRPGAIVVPSSCEFSPDQCAADLAVGNRNVSRSLSNALCYCSTCALNQQCDLYNTPSNYGQDVDCYTAALASTSSGESLATCLDASQTSVDAGCRATRAACNLASVPPYDGIADGEVCYAAVLAAFSSAVSTANCMNTTGFSTSDTGCVQARLVCTVSRPLVELNYACLYAVLASLSGTTAPPTTPPPFSFTLPPPAFPPPATATTAPPAAVPACFDPSVPAPNASCATARATCNVWWPQPYLATDAPCYALLQLGNTSAACSNPYNTAPDTYCSFLRNNCSQYYDPATAEPIAGYCLPGDTCGNFVPAGCVLDVDTCGPTQDVRCSCTNDPNAFPTVSAVPLAIVEGIVYGLSDLYVAYEQPPIDGVAVPIAEPVSDPLRLPRVLRFPDPNGACPTQLWRACDCLPLRALPPSWVLSTCERDPLTNQCDPTGNYTAENVARWADPVFAATHYVLWPDYDYRSEFSNTFGDRLQRTVCSAASHTLKCDCSFSYLVSITTPPTANTTAIFLENVRYNDTDFQFVDNAACDYYYGYRGDQNDPLLIRATAFGSARSPFDRFAEMRDHWLNPNDYITGQVDMITHPFSYNALPCIGGCQRTVFGVEERLHPSQFDYIVDGGVNTRSPAYGVTIFRSLYHVLAAGSGDNKRVLVINYGRFYAEPQPYTCPANTPGCLRDQRDDELALQLGKGRRNWKFISYDGAVVVVQDFQIITPYAGTVTFQGIRFQHPGGSKSPIFKVTKSKDRPRLERIAFLNCVFDGVGVGAAGIISVYGEVTDLIFSYCTITNWNVYALFADRVRHFVLEGSTVSNCLGNCIQARVMDTYSIDSTTFRDCRGGGDIKGAAVITITGVLDDFDSDNNNIDSLPRMCNPDRIATRPAYYPGAVPANASDPNTVWILKCRMWEPIHITALDGKDYDDAFIEVWEGNYTEDIFRGVAVLKARYGIALYGTDLDPTPENLDLLARQNPRVRTKKYRSPDAATSYDYRGIARQSWVERFFGFTSRDRESWQVDWPANTNIQAAFRDGNISLVVNNEFSPFTMDDSTPFNVLRLEKGWAYAYAEFRNLSDAALYGEDFRTWLSDDFNSGQAPEVYVSAWYGSRFYRDNVTLVQDIRIYGNISGAQKGYVDVRLPGDNFTTPMLQGYGRGGPNATVTCDQPTYRPCVRGKGNTISTDRVLIEDMCWQLLDSKLGQNLWQSGDPLPTDVRIHRCSFDGRNVIPRTTTYGLLLYMGVTFPDPEDEPEQTDVLPPPTQAYFEMTDCTFENFTVYDPRVVATTARGRRRIVKLENYPITSGAVVLFVNRLNTVNAAVIQRCNFTNMDRTGLAVRFVQNLTLTDSFCFNCSGRSIGNTAAFFLEGNNLYSTEPDESNDAPPGRGLWIVDRNYIDQKKTIFTPYGPNTALPVLVAAYYVRSIAQNTTFCMRNNSAKDLPVAARYTDFNQTLLANCPSENNIGFPDRFRYLRFNALENRCENASMNGTVFDLEFSFAGTQLESQRDALVCQECCPPGNATECYVDTTTILFNPTHPWWDKYVFNSVNRAIQLCQAPQRTIFIIGTSDPFLAYDGLAAPYHIYTEVIDTVVPPNYPNQTGPLRIVGDVGLEFRGCGHRLDNPNNVEIIVQTITFRHMLCPSTTRPTWDFITNASLSTGNIRLDANVFDGNGTSTARPIDGNIIGVFQFTNNLMENYTNIEGVRFVGRVCNQTLAGVRVAGNTFVKFVGHALEIAGFDDARSEGNDFVECGGSALIPVERAVSILRANCANTPGDIRHSRNTATAPAAGVDTDPSKPLWTAFFIAPVPWNLRSFYTQPLPSDKKVFRLASNRATGGFQVGMRLDNTPVKCDGGDPQNFLRFDVYERFSNVDVEGDVFDLLIAPFDRQREDEIKAASDAAELFGIKDTERCYHCEDGCPLFQIDAGTWGPLLAAGAIVVLIFLIWFFCPGACWCCPCCKPDLGTHYDVTLQTQVLNRRSHWWQIMPYMFPANYRNGKQQPIPNSDTQEARGNGLVGSPAQRLGALRGGASGYELVRRNAAERFPASAAGW